MVPPCAATIPDAVPVPAPPTDDADIELRDDELEHVVGGLTRPWEGMPASALLSTLPLPPTAAILT